MEKKKFRFNVVDALVVLLVVAVVLVIGVKLMGGSIGGGDKVAKFEISFLCEEVPEYAANVIELGDKITCEMSDNNLGKVTNILMEPSRTYTTDAQGGVHVLGKPYYNCVTLTAEVIADEYEHGLKVKGAKYGVGHSITIRVGKAKIFGRISGIELIDKLDAEELAAWKATENEDEEV